MHAARGFIVALAIVITSGCATSGSSTNGTQRSGSYRRGDVISAQEIARERASSAYDLVERLRPYYLRGRSFGFMESGPLVYLDDILLGDISALRTINSHEVFEIRYVRGESMRTRISEASGRQVIQVVTRR